MRIAHRMLAAALLSTALLAPTVVGPGRAAAREVETRDEVTSSLSDIRRRLAMGEIDEAVEAAEALHGRHPNEMRIFWALVRAYAVAGLDGDKLVPLLEARTEEAPDDDRAWRELGAAHARLGDFERAHDIWMQLLARPVPDVSLYSEVGAMEIQARMYEQAVEVFDEGRERVGAPTLFAQELALALTSIGDYDRAFDECVTTIVEHPGLVQWAVNRVELMLDLGASRDEMLRKTEALAASESAVPPSLSLAGSLFVLFDRPEQALDAFLRSDELAGHAGRALLEFGAILEEKGWEREAREAYRTLVERYPRGVNAAMAGMRAALLDSRLGDPEAAVVALEELADEFDGTAAAGQALLEAARLQMSSLASPVAALSTVERVLADFPRAPAELLDAARELELDALLALARLDELYEFAASVAEGPGRSGARPRALFELAYVSFQRGDAERSLEEFRTLVTEDPSGDLVNDAVRLMLLISDAGEGGDPDALAAFAAAHLAWRSGDTASARRGLSSLIEEELDTPLAVEAAMLAGALAEDDGDVSEALSIYARVFEGSLSLAARAEAAMRIGDIRYESTGREEALESYRAVIDDLPPNFLSGEARRKIERMTRRDVG